tara:strand:+ start:1399 stop:1896 length:498 start_codon:yes stop_codon:yes gene_type:complete
MARLYLVIIVLGVLGGVGYGAWQYYNDTQQRIQTLAENNAKLETALETSEKSIDAMREQAAQTAVLTKKLQEDLQKAEQYGDNLRTRLRQLDLLADAIADAKNLEGRMNGATAKLWREIMGETGNSAGSSTDLPFWLQSKTGSGSKNSNDSTESNSTDSSQTQAD